MSRSLPATRQQLARVYDLMYITGKPGYEEVTLAEEMFSTLSDLLDLLPEEGATELLFRLSEGVPALKVAELYNILIWSADARGTIDAEEIQEWFYSKQRRRIEIACQVDLFPSNSMDESERVVKMLLDKYPEIDYLLYPLAKEIKAHLKEEKAWSDYRRDTFEMPKELTPDIMKIIQGIKTR
ncbi:hypothetical protein [Lewinella sp. IMCC34191]|uniref:hypothetical protein n=1 Tax=Lewinella sp. IMCC34191 TaxID=2259172 RepID=UPI000E26DD30|nr:hypothetical protein [Lewinella sp. IMCC34191]